MDFARDVLQPSVYQQKRLLLRMRAKVIEKVAYMLKHGDITQIDTFYDFVQNEVDDYTEKGNTEMAATFNGLTKQQISALNINVLFQRIKNIHSVDAYRVLLYFFTDSNATSPTNL